MASKLSKQPERPKLVVTTQSRPQVLPPLRPPTDYLLVEHLYGGSYRISFETGESHTFGEAKDLKFQLKLWGLPEEIRDQISSTARYNNHCGVVISSRRVIVVKDELPQAPKPKLDWSKFDDDAE